MADDVKRLTEYQKGDNMFCIQWRILEEGFGAQWSELSNTRHESRIDARRHLIAIRETDDIENLNQYRITKVGSPEYYSQPTDKLEY